MHVALGVESCSHCNQVRVDIEHISNHLRGGCFVTLALGARTNSDDNLAIDIQLAVCALRVSGKRRIGIHDLRLAKIVGSRIERGADSDSYPAPLGSRLNLSFFPILPVNLLFGDL